GRPRQARRRLHQPIGPVDFFVASIVRLRRPPPKAALLPVTTSPQAPSCALAKTPTRSPSERRSIASRRRRTATRRLAGDGAMARALYFQADDGTHGKELAKLTSDGQLITFDLNRMGDSNAAGFTTFNGELYFAADDGAHGTELWKV